MKSYLQGLIGGGVIVFTFFVLTGQRHGHHSMDDIMHNLKELEEKLKSIETGVYCYNVD